MNVFMDFSKYADLFGNPELTSGEVQSLISYTLFFIFVSLLILIKSKRKIVDSLAFAGLYLIITQQTYHLAHGEQLDQYPGFVKLNILGFILYAIAWWTVISRNTKAKKYSFPSKNHPSWYNAYWYGFFMFVVITIYVVMSIPSKSFGPFSLSSNYPDMNDLELIVAWTYIIVGVLFAYSYRGAYND